MIVIVVLAIYFYYIAASIYISSLFISSYISQSYLFVVANNVGYLKLFAGL